LPINKKNLLKMKKITTLAIAALLGFGATAQKTVWNLDKSHSAIKFDVDHMVISETNGQFKTFTISCLSDKPDFSDMKMTLTIDVNSINTEDEGRDKHLTGEDFFDAAKNPNITFVATSFTKVKGNMYKLAGNFTMHGITKPVVLAAKYNGIIKDPYGNTRTGFTIAGDIDRYAYNLKYNSKLEAGGLAIGQTVRFKASIELLKAK
jgi:polyisoprenoid-binding protein YceI